MRGATYKNRQTGKRGERRHSLFFSSCCFFSLARSFQSAALSLSLFLSNRLFNGNYYVSKRVLFPVLLLLLHASFQNGADLLSLFLPFPGRSTVPPFEAWHPTTHTCKIFAGSHTRSHSQKRCVWNSWGEYGERERGKKTQPLLCLSYPHVPPLMVSLLKAPPDALTHQSVTQGLEFYLLTHSRPVPQSLPPFAPCNRTQSAPLSYLSLSLCRARPAGRLLAMHTRRSKKESQVRGRTCTGSQ